MWDSQALRLVAAQVFEGAIGLELSFEEFDLAGESVIAGVLGLGRLQPLLEDADISDIHIRGASPVWVKRRDGSRICVEPIVDSDEELIEEASQLIVSSASDFLSAFDAETIRERTAIALVEAILEGNK